MHITPFRNPQSPPPVRQREEPESSPIMDVLDSALGTALPSFAGAAFGGGLGVLAGTLAGVVSHCALSSEVSKKTLLLGAANGALCGLVGSAFGPGGAAVLTASGAVASAVMPHFLDQ